LCLHGALFNQVWSIHLAQSAQDFGRRKAVSLALVAVLPEFLYAAGSVFLSEWLERNPLFQTYAQGFLPFILFGVGMALVLKRKTLNKGKFHGSMKAKGLLLGLLNFQLPLYWLGIVMAFSHLFGWTFKTFPEKLALILGAGFGAFSMLLVWIWVFDRLANSRFQQVPFSRIFGLILIAIAIVAWVKM